MPEEPSRSVSQQERVSLPLLNGTGRPRSRMGRWRALVLGAVHVVIIIHVILWLVMGSTLSPVEPSESMQTLELGLVNAGFIFFVLAILSTLVFGRFFCGWGCHVVALQDLCGWMMKKLGTRPKPFRSRLLVLAPLALGIYMFIWPTFKRVAVMPALDAAGIVAPVWFGEPAPFHGFKSDLIVEDFWATFPPWYVAIPFLGICGFACVYFLGAKGFCTYGCPYGGLFGVADPVSPGRIVVNDSCEGCGHCTAVCTSNVRVHEEVRDFGAVVDPGCMKCMDCVSACPNDALSFGFARPAVLTRPVDEAARARRERISASPRRYDASLREELVIAAMGVGFFVAFRGMLNLVPMLMAVGMAGVAAFVVWKAWRVLTRPSVRLQSLQLRTKGRFRRSGIVVVAASVLLVVSAAWSGWVRSDRWRAHLTHETIGVPVAVATRPEFDPSPALAGKVDLAVRLYERSRSPRDGGVGWTLRPQDRRELAFLYQLQDRTAEAVEQLELLADEGRPTDELVLQSIRLRRLAGESERGILEALDRTLRQHPELHETRLERSRIALALGVPPEDVERAWEDIVAGEPGPEVLLSAATLYIEIGRPDRAAELAGRAAGLPEADASARLRAARVLAGIGDRASSAAVLETIDAGDVRSPEVFRAIGTAWATAGDRARAGEAFNAGLAAYPDSAGLHEARALLALVEGDAAAAERDYRRAIELAADNPFALAGVGESVVRAGLGSRRLAIYELGTDAMRQAAESSGEAVLFHDLGQALLAGGQRAAGLEALDEAVRRTPENDALRQAAESAKTP